MLACDLKSTNCIRLLVSGLASVIVLGLMSGCGATKANVATEHLLTSDAVDGAVAKLDFTPLTGQRVYFDTKYISDYKGIGFVNSNYVISSLRQQMIAAGLLLQETQDKADFVVEARIGALGADSHEIVYGIPATNNLSAATSAAAAFSPLPAIPGIPELSVARRNDQVAAAKIGVFAYDVETRIPVWQSGLSVARATAKDLWLFGVGPFQRGTIYDGDVRFAGNLVNTPATMAKREGLNGPIASYKEEKLFQDPEAIMQAELAAQQAAELKAQAEAEAAKVQQASAEEEAK
ncbi:MAG: hypothetical protein KDA80_11680 [Planctomycetaceae bacterium]|nr:hypothetical protein [Planctomycetaceae bacterium]